MKGRDPAALSCTPHGVMQLLKRSNVDVRGKRTVVVGRSNIVGMPVAFLLMHADATVTICHSRTPQEQLISHLKEAEIVVAAAGVAQMIRGEWLKPGCTVIDVGMHSIPDATKKSGQRLVGDVLFDEAKEVAGKITPVPGGVGPMTIAMLLQNTVDCFKKLEGVE